MELKPSFGQLGYTGPALDFLGPHPSPCFKRNEDYFWIEIESSLGTQSKSKLREDRSKTQFHLQIGESHSNAVAGSIAKGNKGHRMTGLFVLGKESIRVESLRIWVVLWITMDTPGGDHNLGLLFQDMRRVWHFIFLQSVSE